MIRQCKHCGSPYPQSKGQGEFCCVGCEHVYGLIEEGGLGDFYALQDGAGQPVGDRPFDKIDFVLINQLQEQAGSASECKIVVKIKGMSCMGCAWLIEQLAKRHKGVLFARVALSASCLSLGWKRGDFDLYNFAHELHKFGYRITGDVASAGYAVSPLAMRFALTLIFSLNGLLLTIASSLGIGSAQLQQLYILLIAACLLFSMLIGGSIFLRPVWRGLLLRRLHRDALPALVLLFLFGLAFSSLFILGNRTEYIFIFCISLPVMVLVQWLSELRALRSLSLRAD